MSGDRPPPPEPVRIRSASDLFTVLSSGTVGAQLAVLRDIIANPLRATALGPHQNEDLVDLLLRLIPTGIGPLKQARVICLMSFDDPRVTEYLLAEFARSTDPATILHLGKRLSMHKDAEFFRTFLFSQNGAQALAAARHCSQGLELSPREQLRVAVVLDTPFAPPRLSEQTLEVWMEALAGPDRVRVRALAEQRGEEVLMLWTRFSQLAAGEQEWLVELTAGLQPAFLQVRLPELLRDSSVGLSIVQQALQLGVELPPSLLQSPSEQVRATAIAAGLADNRLDRFLTAEASNVEAAAAAVRCSPVKQLELLGDLRWEVRAAATESLSRRQLDELPLNTVRTKTTSSFLGERVAAVDLLRRLGDIQWLQDNLGSVQAGPS